MGCCVSTSAGADDAGPSASSRGFARVRRRLEARRRRRQPSRRGRRRVGRRRPRRLRRAGPRLRRALAPPCGAPAASASATTTTSPTPSSSARAPSAWCTPRPSQAHGRFLRRQDHLHRGRHPRAAANTSARCSAKPASPPPRRTTPSSRFETSSSNPTAQFSSRNIATVATLRTVQRKAGPQAF